MDNDWETEKQFLLGVGKFITGLAAAVVAFYLLAPLLPGWLVRFIAMAWDSAASSGHFAGRRSTPSVRAGDSQGLLTAA